MRHFIFSLWLKCLAFLYPRECLGCQETLLNVLRPLCSSCVSYLELSQETSHQVAPTFEDIGPARHLCSALQASLDDHLDQLIISYMIIQYDRLGWSWPSRISFVPSIESIGVKKEKDTVEYRLAKLFAYNLQLPFIKTATICPKEEVFNQDGLLYDIHIKENLVPKDEVLLIIGYELNEHAIEVIEKLEKEGYTDLRLLTVKKR